MHGKATYCNSIRASPLQYVHSSLNGPTPVAGVTYTNADGGDYYCSMGGGVHYANSAYFTVWLSTALANEFWRSVTGLVGTDRKCQKGLLEPRPTPVKAVA
jgi:hypothetical protein